MTVTIGGTNRRSDLLIVGFSVSFGLDGSPSTCTFTVKGTEPDDFADVVISEGGVLLWGGTVISKQARVYKLVNKTVLWNVQRSIGPV